MCHLQVGKEKKVAVVLACPGNEEEKLGLPAAGQTGRNLRVLLDLLSRRLDRSDITRQSITVTNASTIVHYEALDGRSEPAVGEVKDPKNLCRIYEELREITDFVIFCGSSAKIVMDSLKLPNRPKLVHVPHLGSRGLIRVKLDATSAATEDGDAQDMDQGDTLRRLEIVADSIAEQLSKN